MNDEEWQAGHTLIVPANRVCKLHQEGRCTFGGHCRNAHVCRKFWSAIMARRQPAMPAAASGTVATGSAGPEPENEPTSPVSRLLEQLLVCVPPAEEDDAADFRLSRLWRWTTACA